MAEEKKQEKKPSQSDLVNEQAKMVAAKAKLLEANMKYLSAKSPMAKAGLGAANKKFTEEFNQASEQMGSKKVTDNLLQELMGLSKTQVGTGEREGLIPSLLKGKGLSRPEKTEDLGIGKAIQLMGVQQQAEGGQRDSELHPGKLAKQKQDLLMGLVDYAKKTGDRDLLKKLTGVNMQSGESFETDPMTGDLTKKGAREKKQMEVEIQKKTEAKFKRQEELTKINTNFNTTVAEFSQLVAQLKGGIEEGGAGSLLKGFYGSVNTALKNPKFSRTASIPGQIKETSLVFNRILTGQNRVIKGVVEMILQTLPTEFDPPETISAKIEQSVSNAYRIKKAFEKAGLSPDVLKEMSQTGLNSLDIDAMMTTGLNSQEQQELQGILENIKSTPATKTSTLTMETTKEVQSINDELLDIERQLKELE